MGAKPRMATTDEELLLLKAALDALFVKHRITEFVFVAVSDGGDAPTIHLVRHSTDPNALRMAGHLIQALPSVA